MSNTSSHTFNIILSTVVIVALVVPYAVATCTGDALVYRSFDGSCNNLADPLMGAANTTQTRTKEGWAYSDTSAPFETAVQAGRPNERTITRTILSLADQALDEVSFNYGNLLHTILGQHIGHDIILTDEGDVPGVQTPDEADFLVHVQLEDDDPFLFLPFPPFARKSGLLHNVSRNGRAAAIIDANGVRQMLNLQTDWLDLSTVYQRNETENDKLRTFADGMLKIEDVTVTSTWNPFTIFDTVSNLETRKIYDTLPTYANVQVPTETGVATLPQFVFVSGEERPSENQGLALTHLLFHKNHNRLAAYYKANNPSWTDEQLFKKARTVNIAQYQHVVYSEWLPVLVGDLQYAKYIGPYTAYDSTVDGRVSQLFSAAAGRYGHSEILQNNPLYDQCGNFDSTAGWGGYILEAGISGSDPFIPARGVAGAGSFDDWLRDLIYTPFERVDHLIHNSMREINIGVNTLSGIDIPAFNMRRGRDNGLPDFNHVYSVWNGLFPGQNELYDTCSSTASSTVDDIGCFTSWMSTYDDLPTFIQETKDLYGKLTALDSWFGFLAEQKDVGSHLGRTLGKVILDQFRRTRNGDRFWYERLPTLGNLPGLSEPGLTTDELENLVKPVKMSDLLRWNFNLKNIQDRAFQAPAEDEFFGDCVTISRIYLVDGAATVKDALFNGNVVTVENPTTLEFAAELFGSSGSVTWDFVGPDFTVSSTDSTAPYTYALSNLVSHLGCGPFEKEVKVTATPDTGFNLERTLTFYSSVDLC